MSRETWLNQSDGLMAKWMSNRNNSQNLKQPNLVEWLNHPSEKFAHVKLDKIPQVGVKIEILETAI